MNAEVRSGDARAPALVWIKVSPWILETECGRYCIRKYATGIDVLAETGTFRYQAYCKCPEWWFGFAPPQANAALAQQDCEAHVNGL